MPSCIKVIGEKPFAVNFRNCDKGGLKQTRGPTSLPGEAAFFDIDDVEANCAAGREAGFMAVPYSAARQADIPKAMAELA